MVFRSFFIDENFKKRINYSVKIWQVTIDIVIHFSFFHLDINITCLIS